MFKKNKQVTLESLAATMEAGFKLLGSRMDKGFKEGKEDNESLARMVAGGFEHAAKDISGLKDSMVTLERGQEDLKLKLDSLFWPPTLSLTA